MVNSIFEANLFQNFPFIVTCKVDKKMNNYKKYIKIKD